MEELTHKIEQQHVLVNKIRNEISKVLVGQQELIDGLLMGLFTKGHILIEGVPGLAKTSAVKALADTVQALFKRIQFTPDLLPADLIGTEVYRPKTGDFVMKKGPIFNNIILADEINRAPSKVQSALLEAMQEHQVTIGETTFVLDDPFLVLATQNPIEQEGTYPLPEAQVDRFMFKLVIDYPTKAEEKQIMQRVIYDQFEHEAVDLVIDYPTKAEEKQIMQRVGFEAPAQVEAVLAPEKLNAVYQLINAVYMDEKLRDYIVDLVFATRKPADYGRIGNRLSRVGTVIRDKRRERIIQITVRDRIGSGRHRPAEGISCR